MCLEESCFPDCWKVLLLVSVFKNVEERSAAKKYCIVSLLFPVSKVFEKLANNGIVDHLEKCGLFSDFQYDFRSSRWTADLLTVVSDRTGRNYGISGQTFGLILSFLSNRLSQVVLDAKSSQEFPVDPTVPHSSILGPTLSLLYINDLLPDDDTNLWWWYYADDTNLYSKFDHASHLWQHLMT